MEICARILRCSMALAIVKLDEDNIAARAFDFRAQCGKQRRFSAAMGTDDRAAPLVRQERSHERAGGNVQREAIGKRTWAYEARSEWIGHSCAARLELFPSRSFFYRVVLSADCVQANLRRRDVAKLEGSFRDKIAGVLEEGAYAHAPANFHIHAFVTQRSIGQQSLKATPLVQIHFGQFSRLRDARNSERPSLLRLFPR